ncbi:hypothetical protein Goshw_019472 [Gossypium schwendimanii]|uniref:Uncharacterized protein n=1 Tax=Gossypium schwendimanii TaxID=34291 RepID=A0A7J9NB96_GOSSC|nr:hypothetical protein [Gossypium schwendimanii]
MQKGYLDKVEKKCGRPDMV